MSPTTAFGFGLMFAYLVYIAVEIYQGFHGDMNKPKPSHFMGMPMPSTYNRQFTIGGILMVAYAVIRGLTS